MLLGVVSRFGDYLHVRYWLVHSVVPMMTSTVCDVSGVSNPAMASRLQILYNLDRILRTEHL